MFGYIRPNVEELKVREVRIYRAYYCGLCQALKEDFGQTGRLSLSYDMTFVALLLSSLYEMDEGFKKQRCVLHPVVRTNTAQNAAIQYAAEMNILLMHEKCLDDYRDENKAGRYLYARHLGRKSCVLAEKHKEKRAVLSGILARIHAEEDKGSTDCEKMSALFGRAFEEIFVYQNDVWEEELRKLGHALGRFVYIMDAYEDFEDDQKKGLYNPLTGPGTSQMPHTAVRDMLLKDITEAAQAFERLPIIRHVEILRNVLYSGVWMGMADQNRGGGWCGSLRDPWR